MLQLARSAVEGPASPLVQALLALSLVVVVVGCVVFRHRLSQLMTDYCNVRRPPSPPSTHWPNRPSVHDDEDPATSR